MYLSKPLMSFLGRIFRNGAQALMVAILLSLAIYICSNIIQARVYSSALHSQLLELSDLPNDYVKNLNDSISNQQPFTYNATSLDLSVQIPKIIHQTYKTTSIPSNWLSAHTSCEAQHPTYKHYFWTDETARSFIEEHFAWFLSTYDSYPYPIERVDSIRYFLLWHYGGVYIDLDVSCRRPLDPLLAFPAWFPKTQPYGVSNDVMASVPRHPIMLKLALSLQDHNGRLGTGYTTVFWATGPMFVNNILAKWFKAKGATAGSGETIKEYEVRILPPSFYDRTHYSFFGHREGSSWHGSDVVVAKWFYQKLWWVLAGAAMGPAILLVALRRIRSVRRRTKTPTFFEHRV